MSIGTLRCKLHGRSGVVTEVILLGDPVVYIDCDDDCLGIVTQTGSSIKVLWSDETHHRTEIEKRLRLADLDEIEAGCRNKIRG